MFKYIKGLFAPEPEAAAPSNLILFTPTKTEWDAKTVIKLFDAGLGKLHVQPNREWRVGDYEKFLKKSPQDLLAKNCFRRTSPTCFESPTGWIPNVPRRSHPRALAEIGLAEL